MAAYEMKDSASAVEKFTTVAKRGYALAQLKLGTMYIGGKGVEHSNQEAINLYKLAAEQGDDRA